MQYKWLFSGPTGGPPLILFLNPPPFTPNPMPGQPSPPPPPSRVGDALLERPTRTYPRKSQPAHSPPSPRLCPPGGWARQFSVPFPSSHCPAGGLRTQQFMQSLRPIVVQPGQVIFSPGDYPEAFWIVESGKIERRMNPQGTTDSVVVTSLGPGSEVGLRGLTYDTPRAATCVAKEPSVLWRCDRATFRRFLLEFADCRTIRDLTERRMLYSILTDHYLFKRLDRLPGPEVIDRFFNVDLQPGEVLWEQGTEGRNFYVVKSGHLELSERGGNSYVLGPGDSFGASALIFNTRRYVVKLG